MAGAIATADGVVTAARSIGVIDVVVSIGPDAPIAATGAGVTASIDRGVPMVVSVVGPPGLIAPARVAVAERSAAAVATAVAL